MWETFLIPLVIYSAWVCPFEFSFLRYKPDTLFIVDNVVNGFFVIDIVLTFFVAYVDRKSYLLIDDPKKIATRLVKCLPIVSASLDPSHIKRYFFLISQAPRKFTT